ncbi:MAG TPA: hypothetical protein VK600_00750 [Candidatus Saccharimonadales bacterium]|nr:hypothetical protein [Candidatus Saccharimonadales bacterium]
MARQPTLAVAVLAVAGAIILLAGSTVIGLGVLAPQLISSQIPNEVIDTPAVGGAMVALGVGGDLLALIHLATAIALRRRLALALSGGAVLSATMSVLSFVFAVSALVSAASGSATPIVVLPAAAILILATAAYAGAASSLIGRIGKGQPD